METRLIASSQADAGGEPAPVGDGSSYQLASLVLPSVRPADVLELDRIDDVLLSVIFEAKEPIGARMAARLLRDKGPNLSEATVSRSFARMDALGLTSPMARKGRVLTDRGRRHIEDRIERNLSNARFHRALGLRTVEEILDWLKARQLLESQAAEFAAIRASDEQLDDLQRALQGHVHNLAEGADPTPIGLRFHKVLVSAASSPIFSALIGSLYTPTLMNVERALDVILRARGTMINSAADHEAILIALREKNPAAAGLAMSRHLERLQTEAKRFADEASGEGLQETLRLITTARTPHWERL